MELGPYEGNNKHFTKFRYPHTSSWDFEVENNLDPDDGNSLLCGACRLPVFSTPFITTDVDNITLHDQCAHLPEKLEGHVLHPAQALLRHTNQPTSTTISCSRCRSICGTTFYKCGDPQCKIQLDVSCALTVKILHRSHEHRLTAVRGTSLSFICAVCGTQHKRLNVSLGSRRKSWDITSYMCSFCDFWIHPDCALLPNAIFLLHPFHRHQHPLLLTYDLGFSDGPPFAVSKCEICGAWLDCLVIYFCGMCRYRAHVKCVMEAPRSLGLISDSSSFFKRVLIREAPIPDLLRLPMTDEHTNVMQHIINTTADGGDGTITNHDNSYDDNHDRSGKLFADKHEHPLILHDADHGDDDHDHTSRVCNACIRSISRPFYSCSECLDFFLHSCCAHLPHKLSKHPFHDSTHPLFLFSKVDTTPFNIFWCNGCDTKCNGFAYSCKTCDFHLDVVCAFRPGSISHDAHGKAHILYPVNRLQEACNCCDSLFLGFHSGGYSNICYECNICRNFRLHYKCALLPGTVRHRFDRHPLKLITTTKSTTTQTQTHPDDRGGYSRYQEQFFCEICEGYIVTSRWYYGCDQCDQSFHAGCIPCSDYLSNIKFGFSVRVRCHDCPVTCVRAITVYGHQCGYCRETIGEESIKRETIGGIGQLPSGGIGRLPTGVYSGLAFECAACYFRIHYVCCEKTLLEENVEIDIAGDSS